MRKLSYGECLFISEVYPKQVAVQERRKRRHLNNKLYSYSEERRIARSRVYCGDILCLIQAGFTFNDAIKLLRE